MKKLTAVLALSLFLGGCINLYKTDDSASQTLKSEIVALNAKIEALENEIKELKADEQSALDAEKAEPIVEVKKVIAASAHERDLALAAYSKVDLMLLDAVSYHKSKGRAPTRVKDLGEFYDLTGFKTEIYSDGPAMVRKIDGNDVYRIHFTAPYAKNYDNAQMRKVCESKDNDAFISICGFLSGKDLTEAEADSLGYYRTALP
ncbi:hypothetical protein Emin_1491 [Elusimicrobium minutum Pei191]|uniref:Lipoprotein n=1 Tax=Elusimicrobium minutum (strain Pei191) TaxID=445932 RepID=B2KEU3_ELUMP|nr:hypothetical protein [Elusimicrobium minutum]ACC99039.1 hypothetical protein Emin_1491 [Elusimicrobium minutum Pei191]